MDHKTSVKAQVDGWDTYWQGTGETEAFSCGGASHPDIQLYWNTFFNSIKNDYKNPKIIDIASGNGVIVDYALAVFNQQIDIITSIDISNSAIKNIKQRFQQINGIVSDAASIPFDDQSYDIVTSQYGVEYAGHQAIFEAARLVAKGGILSLILHIEAGIIHQDSLENLEAIKRLQASEFIPLTIKMFEAGFKAVDGSNRQSYEEAALNLAPAIKELEKIMTQFGQSIADSTIVRLYNDIGQIHQQIQAYDPSEVLNWLNKMDLEIHAYSERMCSMCHSTISQKKFEQIQENLIASGFSIESAKPLFVSDHEKPMAWILQAKKQTKEKIDKNSSAFD